MPANEKSYLESEIAKYQYKADHCAASGNEGGRSTYQRYVNRYTGQLESLQGNGGLCKKVWNGVKWVLTCGSARSQGRSRKVQKRKQQKKSLTRRNRKI
jgi:hypothetical protein